MATVAFAKPATAVVDGQVAAGEYPPEGTFADPATGMTAYLVHDGTNLTGAVVSPGTGWVGIGFGAPGVVMDGYNILIGYVTGATTVFTDQFGLGLDHRPDETDGGTNNLMAFAGTESGGRTTIEFRIPLDSGDSHDYRLAEGETVGFMLAYQETADDLVSMHTKASLGTVFIAPNPDRIPTRHASLSLAYNGTATEGGGVTLLATLVGDDGAPYAPARLQFWENASVGWGELGVADVNRTTGVAAYNLTLLTPGRYEFQVRFGGDRDYLPTETNLSFVADGASSPEPPVTLGFAARFVLFTVLASVALVFGFSASQVVRIRRMGRRARAEAREKRQRGREWNGGDTKP